MRKTQRWRIPTSPLNSFQVSSETDFNSSKSWAIWSSTIEDWWMQFFGNLEIFSEKETLGHYHSFDWQTTFHFDCHWSCTVHPFYRLRWHTLSRCQSWLQSFFPFPFLINSHLCRRSVCVLSMLTIALFHVFFYQPRSGMLMQNRRSKENLWFLSRCNLCLWQFLSKIVPILDLKKNNWYGKIY